jgi:hypothetical protein
MLLAEMIKGLEDPPTVQRSLSLSLSLSSSGSSDSNASASSKEYTSAVPPNSFAYRKYIEMEGSHNSMRPLRFFEEASEFLKNSFMTMAQRERLPSSTAVIPRLMTSTVPSSMEKDGKAIPDCRAFFVSRPIMEDEDSSDKKSDAAATSSEQQLEATFGAGNDRSVGSLEGRDKGGDYSTNARLALTRETETGGETNSSLHVDAGAPATTALCPATRGRTLSADDDGESPSPLAIVSFHHTDGIWVLQPFSGAVLEVHEYNTLSNVGHKDCFFFFHTHDGEARAFSCLQAPIMAETFEMYINHLLRARLQGPRALLRHAQHLVQVLTDQPEEGQQAVLDALVIIVSVFSTLYDIIGDNLFTSAFDPTIGELGEGGDRRPFRERVAKLLGSDCGKMLLNIVQEGYAAHSGKEAKLEIEQVVNEVCERIQAEQQSADSAMMGAAKEEQEEESSNCIIA